MHAWKISHYYTFPSDFLPTKKKNSPYLLTRAQLEPMGIIDNFFFFYFFVTNLHYCSYFRFFYWPFFSIKGRREERRW